ncbi:MAG: hypothetical protein JW753_11555 [Dehalococcoidia bacterium]|nr:hypothetical protein [Dehalococcoidia bacterium]
MSLQTLSPLKNAVEVTTSKPGHRSDHGSGETVKEIESVLVDVALEVGALIDAVCCRCGDWVDWQYYRPHPGTRGDGHIAAASIISLALAESDCGLRAGGYVEIYILPEEKLVEADGGYYDECHQPRQVIGGSLRWQEVDHQTVGQALLLMYARIMREYLGQTGFAEHRLMHPEIRADKPAHSLLVTGSEHDLAAVRTRQ